MNFNLTEDQEMVIQMIRVFVEKEVKPVASEMDAACEFPSPLVKKLGEMGLMGAFIPLEWDGSGQ